MDLEVSAAAYVVIHTVIREGECGLHYILRSIIQI
jgi:hypothetical protein